MESFMIRMEEIRLFLKLSCNKHFPCGLLNPV